MNAMALFSPFLCFIFIYFVVIFYIHPELTTVNRCVKSSRHFENNLEKKTEKNVLVVTSVAAVIG